MNLILRALSVLAVASSAVSAQVPTTRADFFTPGTQPGPLEDALMAGQSECSGCHGFYDQKKEPYRPWASSMMGQAARDPVFLACLSVANQDAAFVGDLCIRCHTPGGWLEGHAADPNGGDLTGQDLEGVSCSACHRLVNPAYVEGVEPARDFGILALLQHPVPIDPASGRPLSHNASLVFDPYDYRRGPFSLPIYGHYWEQSPYFRSGNMCGNCHDVSNPAFSRQPNGSYQANALDQPHPTGNKYDMFPIERTFSEWSQSAFAQGPVEMGGRFGGNITAVSSCQECHMPRTTYVGCDPVIGSPVRPDMPQHHFAGANSWVMGAVRSLYPDAETDLTANLVQGSIGRTLDMLAAASDMEATYDEANSMNVRVTNQTGHKLPSGYPEGRAMWINARFFSADGSLIAEYGRYDAATSAFDRNTKVYETVLGLDAHAAAVTGLPEGPSFHFAVNNKWFLDNRIPPRGFTNAGFNAVGAGVVGYSYADGQYWDDTQFPVPPAAVRADIRLYHQTTTKEYIEFLRDANTTDNRGQIAYNQWLLHGKSQPAVLDDISIDLTRNCSVDFNMDGLFPDTTDIDDLLGAFRLQLPAADINRDTVVTFADVDTFLKRFSGEPCQ